MSTKKAPPQNLAAMQSAAEAASRTYRNALAAFERARTARDKAEEAYSRTQKTFQSAVEQVKSSTKVSG